MSVINTHIGRTITPRIKEPCRDDSPRFPPVPTATSPSISAPRPRQGAMRSTGRYETETSSTWNINVIKSAAKLLRSRTKLPGICWARSDDSISFCEQFSFSLDLYRSLFHSALFLFFVQRFSLAWRAHLEDHQIANYWQRNRPSLSVLSTLELGACNFATWPKIWTRKGRSIL